MDKKIIRHPLFFPLFAFGLFLILAFVFTLFRKPVSSISKWLLLMSGEVTMRKHSGSNKSDYSRSQHRQKNKRKKIASKKRKPQKCKLPKTAPCYALFSNSEPSSAEINQLPVLPPLRKYTGERWTKENTVIRIAVTSDKLYFYCKCYDHHPEDIITKFSRQSPNNAWKDDSIEFFIMKNENADKYIQYVTSASGKSCVFYMLIKNKKNKATGSRGKLPDNFLKPVMNSEDFSNGYLITMEINIKNNFGITLHPGDTLLFQIVRNYRGQGIKGCVTLQMFPTYIYADSRGGIQNHNRNAFQELKIIDKAEFEKLKKQEIKFKDINLKKAIASALNLKENSLLTPESLKQLKSFKLINKKIFSLKGIEYCSELEALNLSNDNIRDIKPIFWLANLTTLNLSHNKIDNIDALIGCPNLKILNLSNNRIRNFPISKLSGFKNLEDLNISYNKFVSLEGLLNMKKLKRVNIKKAFLSKNKHKCKEIIKKLKKTGVEVIE